MLYPLNEKRLIAHCCQSFPFFKSDPGGTTTVGSNLSNGTGTASYQWKYYSGGSSYNVTNGVPTGAVYTNSNLSSMTISGTTQAGTHQYYLAVTMSGSGCDAANSPLGSFIVTPTVSTCITTTTADVTGRSSIIWMDRNMGATQVATSATDYQAYGSLYQWGRLSDGHQCINWSCSTTGSPINGTTSTTSTSTTPGHSLFIVNNGGYANWITPENTNLWQGVSGINNPCPSGYRIPTKTEFEVEQTAGFATSPLMIPRAGLRESSTGVMNSASSAYLYWTSTAWVGGGAYALNSYNSTLNASTYGASVRCIKDAGCATPAVAPTLNVGSTSPANGTSICTGTWPSATGNSGSGGSTGSVDEYQVSINGGSSYSAYSSGDGIATGSASGSVIVQSRRTGGVSCPNSAWSTICTWTVTPAVGTPSAPTPTAAVCVGQSIAYSTSAANATSYTWSITNGNSISGTGSTSSVTWNNSGWATISVYANGCNGPSASASSSVYAYPLPTISGTTPGYRCGTGTVGLSATSPTGSIRWYDGGGTLLGTVASGATFTTPSISATTTYYAEAVDNCPSAARTAVTATVYSAPSWASNSVSPTSGSATLLVYFSASVSGGASGSVSWIRATSSGGTGSTVTSPYSESSAGTFYYRPRYNDATGYNGCSLADGSETAVTVSAASSACGGATTVRDVIGTTYKIVEIGSQCWMAENLTTTQYRDRTSIPTSWGVSTPAYCCPSSRYGLLYNGYAVTSANGLCPTGWHVPTDAEWSTLGTYVGGLSVAGGILKDQNCNISLNYFWDCPNTATNDYKFSAHSNDYKRANGTLTSCTKNSLMWTSTLIVAGQLYDYSMANTTTILTQQNIGVGNMNYGLAVRCIKDP